MNAIFFWIMLTFGAAPSFARFPLSLPFPIALKKQASPHSLTLARHDNKSPYAHHLRTSLHSFFMNSNQFDPENIYFFEIEWEQLSGAGCPTPNENNGRFRDQFLVYIENQKVNVLQVTPLGQQGYKVTKRDPKIRFPFTYDYFASAIFEWKGFILPKKKAFLKSQNLLETFKNAAETSGSTLDWSYSVLLPFFQKHSDFALVLSDRSWREKFRSCARRLFGLNSLPAWLLPPGKTPDFGLLKENHLVNYGSHCGLR